MSPSRLSRASAALLLAPLLAACPGVDPEPVTPPAVAEVNGQPILAEALARDLRRLSQEGVVPSAPVAQQAKLRQRTLDRRIDQVLLLQVAEEHQVSASPDEVERALLAMRSNYPGRAFEEFLAEEGILLEDVKEDIRRRLTIQRLVAEEINAKVTVSEAEVAEWYAAHPEVSQAQEQVHTLQIFVTDEEEARRLHGELKRGADFATLARTHSLAPEGADGGDLGWFPKGVMPPPIDEVAFSLKTGRLSDVVESDYGYHLFKVVERRKAGDRPLDDGLKVEIENRLRREKEEAAQKAWLVQLREQADIKIHPEVLEQVR